MQLSNMVLTDRNDMAFGLTDGSNTTASNSIMETLRGRLADALSDTSGTDNVQPTLEDTPVDMRDYNRINAGILSEAMLTAVYDNIEKPAKKIRYKQTKIKKNVSEAEVVDVINSHTKEKIKRTKNLSAVKKAQLVQLEKSIEDSRRLLATETNKTKFFEAQEKRLKHADVKKQFLVEINNLKHNPLITNLTIDNKKRIIVTTAPLFVKKEDWDKEREAGQYQIRIDFSHPDISSGIQILNITRRMDNHYDSPTISNTDCCWGNTQQDFQQEFDFQNVEELVVDLIEYIRSPKDEAGYLGSGGDGNHGWEMFLKQAKKCAKNFSFEAYDKLNHSRDRGIEMEYPSINAPQASVTPGSTEYLDTRFYGSSFATTNLGVWGPSEVMRVDNSMLTAAQQQMTYERELARRQQEEWQTQSLRAQSLASQTRTMAASSELSRYLEPSLGNPLAQAASQLSPAIGGSTHGNIHLDEMIRDVVPEPSALTSNPPWQW